MASRQKLNAIPDGVDKPTWLSVDFARQLARLFVKNELFSKKLNVTNKISYYQESQPSEPYTIIREHGDCLTKADSRFSVRICAFFGSYTNVKWHNPLGISASRGLGTIVLRAFITEIPAGPETVTLSCIMAKPRAQHEDVILRSGEEIAETFLSNMLRQIRDSSINTRMPQTTDNSRGSDPFSSSDMQTIAALISSWVMDPKTKKWRAPTDINEKKDVLRRFLRDHIGLPNFNKESYLRKEITQKLVSKGPKNSRKDSKTIEAEGKAIYDAIRRATKRSEGGSKTAAELLQEKRKRDQARLSAEQQRTRDQEEAARAEIGKALQEEHGVSATDDSINIENGSVQPEQQMPKVYQNSSIIYVLKDHDSREHFSIFVIDLHQHNIVYLDTGSRAPGGAALQSRDEAKAALIRYFQAPLPLGKHADVMTSFSSFTFCYPLIEWQQQAPAGTGTCVPFAIFLMCIYHVNLLDIRAVTKENSLPYNAGTRDMGKEATLNAAWDQFKVSHSQVSTFLYNFLNTDSLDTK